MTLDIYLFVQENLANDMCIQQNKVMNGQCSHSDRQTNIQYKKSIRVNSKSYLKIYHVEFSRNKGIFGFGILTVQNKVLCWAF